MVCYSHLFKSFTQFVMIHTVKGFSVVSETQVVFLEFPCFLYDPVNAGNLISGSSSFSQPILDIWKLLVCIMLKPMRTCKNIEGVQEHVRHCKSLRGHVKPCEGVQEHVRVCEYMRGRARVCKGMRGRVMMCKSGQGQARAC